MLRILATIVAVSLLLTPAGLAAADPSKDGGSRPETKTGPEVPRFGAIYTVENPDFPTPVDRVYKVVFDVHKEARASNR